SQQFGIFRLPDSLLKNRSRTSRPDAAKTASRSLRRNPILTFQNITKTQTHLTPFSRNIRVASLSPLA
ncbi:MAG: hypothetical protein N2B03_07480, partial [Boseongicola sp.]